MAASPLTRVLNPSMTLTRFVQTFGPGQQLYFLIDQYDLSRFNFKCVNCPNAQQFGCILDGAAERASGPYCAMKFTSRRIIMEISGGKEIIYADCVGPRNEQQDVLSVKMQGELHRNTTDNTPRIEFTAENPVSVFFFTAEEAAETIRKINEQFAKEMAQILAERAAYAEKGNYQDEYDDITKGENLE